MHVRNAAFVVAVCALLAAAHPARAEIPLDLTPDELDCHNATFVGSTTYVQQAFAARHDCFLAYMNNAPEGIDCSARLEDGGTGDPLTDERLDQAQRTLSETLTHNCFGLLFDNLGFPGFCPIDIAGEYTSTDHEVCIVMAWDDVVDVLFGIEHPTPIEPPLTTSESGCGDTIESQGLAHVRQRGRSAQQLPDEAARAAAPPRGELPRRSRALQPC